MVVPIFVEAGPDVGLGHLRRVCSVADELQKRKLQPILFCENPDVLRMQVPSTLPVRHWTESQDSKLWLVDAINLPLDFLPQLEFASQCVSLSPALVSMQLVTILIHRGGREELQNLPAQVLCGPEWSVIGQNLPRLSRQTFQSRLNGQEVVVGVCLGGGSNDDLLRDCLRQLKRMDIRVQLLAARGAFSSSRSDDWENVVFVEASSSTALWEEMSKALVVVTRAGITPFEASYVGVPSLMLERGRGFCDTLLAEGVAELACPGDLGKSIANCIRCPERLMERFELGQQLVDGAGASRIAGVIVSLCEWQPQLDL